MARRYFLIISMAIISIIVSLSFFWKQSLYAFYFFSPLILLGFYDMLQTRHTIKRNFPIIGRFRYMMETIRPEIQQYFVESDDDGKPINREYRSIVYQRAKGELQTVPFGTKRDVYQVGFEWINHSMRPTIVDPLSLRTTIGNKDCTQPYNASLLNISAMSYGAISNMATLSFNGGAKIGNFSHNTGEGGLAEYHLKPGGDVVWQIGTGYFGCRTPDGEFSEKIFQQKAIHPHVKMIELKISQGAKPSYGGVLPKAKISKEIAEIRGIPRDRDCISPAYHHAFHNNEGMILFIQKLRELSGGKPVGFKLCMGQINDFLEVCRTMKRLNIFPDFITIDGAEGGTGAAPLEFLNVMGQPLRDGLSAAHNALVGFNIRHHIKLIASGKILTAFHMIKAITLGADLCNSARGMMLALGCIHALRCNTNHCPVGIATNDPGLTVGLKPELKKSRIANYQRDTLKAMANMIGAMGLDSPSELNRSHIVRRVSNKEIATYEELYPSVKPGDMV